MIFKTAVSLLAFFIFSLSVYSKIIANISEEAYRESEKNLVRVDVVEAAAFYLKSQSDVLLLSNKIELADIYAADYPGLRDIVNSAISNMESANAKYAELGQITENSSYNLTTTDNLKNFDYASFREANKGNSTAAGKACDFLKNGDVTGVYSQLLSDTRLILDRLTIIRSALEKDTMPLTSELWKLNRSYAETLLFGQYVAEIFYQVTGKVE